MRKGFAEALEALITQKVDDFKVSKLFKEEKAHYFAHLGEVFARSSPKGFLVHHTRSMEEFIVQFYRYVLRDSFGNYLPSVSSLPIAFVALGSFGREQTAPYSDIDLMIVYKEVKGYHLRPLIERVLYLAWDAGFHLGHRVHEVHELEAAARTDVTIKTAMLEGRFFYGSRFLWVEIENALNHIRLENQAEFIRLKLEEYADRRRKKPVTMEPDIKEGVGGLRDSNTLFWIAKVLFGVNANKDLTGREISDEDYREYRQALEFLYRLRSALHLIAKKKLDTLAFDYQRETALFLGFHDTKTRKAERYLLKRTLQALGDLDRFCDFYLAKLTRNQSPQNTLCLPFDGPLPPFKTLLEQVVAAPLHSRYDITLVMALHKSATPLRSGSGPKKLLLKLFYRPDCHGIIELFERSGRLESLLPPLKPVINLAQFDGYHKRAVDEHSLLTLKNLNTLEESGPGELFGTLDEDEKALLRMVALLHDCGKGGIHDHSEVGAKRFKNFAQSLGMKAELVETGVLLIRVHTLMSHVARTQDIYSDRVVLAFATQLKTQKALTLLYLLTVADLSAVAPGVYSPFVADLLRDLYHRAVNALNKEEQIGEAALRLRKEKQLAAFSEFAALPQPLQRQILAIDSTLFFLKYKPAEIVDLSLKTDATQDFRFDAITHPHLVLDIIAKRPINLGWLLGKLAWLDLSAMDIFKLMGGAKLFRMIFKKPLEEPLEDLAALIEASFDMSRTLPYKKPVIKPSEIEIDCGHSPTYARMSLDTPDQQGLMAFIIDVFDRRGIDIATAKIATVKGQANDLFLIEKNGRFCHNTDEILAELTKG
ncbi:MAG: HD domain-containing protein [Campylobacterales bacterium]